MDWDRLRQDVLHDPVYNPIIQALEKGEKVSQPFVLIHGVLYYKDRLAIPASSEWVARFLSEYHRDTNWWPFWSSTYIPTNSSKCILARNDESCN